MKIVFILPSIDDSHYKNRVLEFIENGYDVKVYGFYRLDRERKLPFEYSLLGRLENARYTNRLRLYIDAFRKIGKEFRHQNVVFYLGGLDIAMCFHYLNPKQPYIYEECDLTHTYLGKIKYVLEWIDKQIIKNSLLTITTSLGFINYHFDGIKPKNVCLVENKLNPNILNYPIKYKEFNKDKLSIGFVGAPRFESVFNFIDVYCRNFPNYTFHVYGGPVSEQFKTLEKYENCIFHGFFNNPVDLPEIYASIDLVLSTYDIKYENVRWAEPNKIYESIYFEKPIIVSSDTFLAEKVNQLGIGYDVNAMNEVQVVQLVRNLNHEDLNAKSKAAKSIDKKYALNINKHLFGTLKDIL